MAILEKIWRHGEGVFFWALAFLYLVPVWAYHFVPTQDGPSHVDNAQILQALWNSAADYEAYFEIRADPIPNWTSHLLLAGLLYVAPPLSAEKFLVSLYILGFAGSFRYFLGAFGERCRPISWLGLLFVYNRCFWMGFYNFCLSLILVWLIVGFCLRRRRELRWPHVAVLSLLFLVAYFTHLVGFVVALTGALGASILAKPRSVVAPILICLTASPACLLTKHYFEQTGFFEQGAARRLVRQPLALIQGGQMEQGLGAQLRAIDRELFEHHAGARPPLSLFLIACIFVFAALAIGEYGCRLWFEASLEATEVVEADRPDDEPLATPNRKPGPGWLFPFVLGFLMLGCYLFLTNDLGVRDGNLPHGGYIKARLALLPPLIWLACLREPANAPLRLVIRALTVVLLGVNLFLVTRTFQEDNKTLEQFTAGIEAVGRGHRLKAIGPTGRGRLANPLVGARHYYCLGTDNLSLDNYEAGTPHFPIKYRPGVTRGQTTDADVLIFWQVASGAAGADWDLVFVQGALRIYRHRACQPRDSQCGREHPPADCQVGRSGWRNPQAVIRAPCDLSHVEDRQGVWAGSKSAPVPGVVRAISAKEAMAAIRSAGVPLLQQQFPHVPGRTSFASIRPPPTIWSTAWQRGKRRPVGPRMSDGWCRWPRNRRPPCRQRSPPGHRESAGDQSHGADHPEAVQRPTGSAGERSPAEVMGN